MQHASSDIVFVMAGDGKDRQRTEDLIRDYKMEDHFILTGMLDSEKVKELLSDTYCLLITSEYEGSPLVLLEAMSMDVPVISTDVGVVKNHH